MPLPGRFDKRRTKLDTGTDLALTRTLLAHQRSLMAWIRTSASLIGFGFTTYKFFQFFAEVGSIDPNPRVLGTRHFGMGLILLGVIALVFATIDYHREMNELEAEYGPIRRPQGEIIAGLVSITGIVLFIVVLLRG